MDNFTEKKWFVYLGDHHEGPHSLQELQAKMTDNQVSTETYVWADGMPDWKVMAEVTDFFPLIETYKSKGISSIGTSMATTHDSEKASTQLIEPQIVAIAPVEVAFSSEAPTVQAPSESHHEEPVLTPNGASEVTQEAGNRDTDGAGSVEEKAEEKSKPQRMLRASPRFVKIALTSLLLLGTCIVYMQGYFDPLFKSPAIEVGTEAFSEWMRPYLLKLAERFQFIRPWVSPLPKLKDVSEEDYEELKAATLDRPELVGPKIALALSKTNVLAPSFYISSNLPVGAKVRVDVIGTPETLLNQLSYETHMEVLLTNQLVKTTPLGNSDGKPLPTGEFSIYLSTPGSQPEPVTSLLNTFQPSIFKPLPGLPKEAKIFLFKTYFLGGTQDATYAERIKEFHDKLRSKAIAEINEIKQFTVTLESQLSSTAVKFSMLEKGKMNGKKRQSWHEFHLEWMALEGQLDEIFRKWTPNVLQEEHFYGNLYQLTQQAGQAIEKVHGYQQGYFSGIQDPKTFQIQLGEASAMAENAITILKAKTEQIEKLPITANGMPTREGI